MSNNIRLINKKTKAVEAYPAQMALNNLILEPDVFTPINEETYFVRGEDGMFHKTLGKDVNRVIGDTSGSLVSQRDFEIESAVRAENSQVGTFLKSFGSEAILLGLNKNEALPQDPIERAKEIKRRELYGGAEAFGSAVGALAPIVVGGVGGVIAGAAKAGAKKAAGKVLKQAGKLPSAQVIKVAGKAGEKVAKIVGGGKTTKKVVQGIATGAAFAGFEAGKAGIQEAKKVRRENEYKKTPDIMNSVLGTGLAKAGDTFLSTSAFMAGTAGVLGVGKIGVKGAGLIGKGVKGFLGPKSMREAFFGTQPGVRGKKSMQELRSKFGSAERTKIVKGDKISDEEVLRNTAKFIDDVVGPNTPKTKAAYLDFIKLEKNKVGKVIKEDRFEFYRGLNKEQIQSLGKNFSKELNNLIKAEKGVLAETTHKGYVNTLKSIKKNVDKDFTPEKIHETIKVLSQKSKWLKREKSELGIDRAYRRAYSKLSDIEDKYYGKVKEGFKISKEGKKVFENFKANKDYFSKLQTSEDVLEKSLPTGTNFLSVFGGFDTKSSIGGLIGYSVAGGPGAVAGWAVGKGAGQARNLGYMHLQIANKTDIVSKAINNNRSVKGVKKIINLGTDLKTEIGVSGLSVLFFGKSFNTLNEFEEQLNALPEHEKFTQGQDELYDVIEEYGGRDNAVNFVAKSAKLKRDIVSIMPEPSLDEKGNKYYTKEAKEAFLKVVSQGISPQGFIASVSKQDLTQVGYEMIKRNYPEWLSEFNANFMKGWKSGEITPKEGGYYRNFLREQDTAVSDFIYNYMDREKREAGAKPPKRMLRKQQPTISQSVTGGY